MKPKLWRCILSIAGFLPESGVIVDAGANDGCTAEALALEFANHTVLAVEPTKTNVAAIKRRKRLHGLVNLEVVRGGLGARASVATYGASLDTGVSKQYSDRLAFQAEQRRDAVQVPFKLSTIDALLEGRPLVLAHLDVEGAEEEALLGGAESIRKYRPLITAESFPISRPGPWRSLMALFWTIGYDAYEVPERCGLDNCRNSLAIPTEWRLALPKECLCTSCDNPGPA